MSTRELRRAEVMGRGKSKTLRLAGAANILEVSYRQTKRLWKRYRGEGAKGLQHRSAGKGSNRAKPEEFRRKVLQLIRKKYSGTEQERFGPTLAAEHLADEDGLEVGDETLRRWMLAEGLWSRMRRRKAHRKRSARRDHFGDLVQLDGSFHAWFEERGPRGCLMNMVDDATKLYYRILKGGTSPLLGPSELWVADLESGHSEALLPGFAVTSYDISLDGRRVAFSSIDADGKSHVWLAPTDRRSPPRQVPNVEGDMPFFGLSGELVVHSVEGGGSFAFRVHEDGTGKQKLASQQIYQILSISPDAQWLVTSALPTGGETTWSTLILPMGGGSSVEILNAFCKAQWQPDSRFFYLSVFTGMQSAGAYGKTYVLPLPHAKMLPDIPAGGFPSEAANRRTSGCPRD